MPDLLFVIDTNKEAIAIAEAKKLKIPVIAIIDSNSNPDGVNYPIPGNDDAGRAITLYCDLIARAAIDGIERAQGVAGIDIGEAEEVSEPLLQMLLLNRPRMATRPRQSRTGKPLRLRRRRKLLSPPLQKLRRLPRLKASQSLRARRTISRDPRDHESP